MPLAFLLSFKQSSALLDCKTKQRFRHDAQKMDERAFAPPEADLDFLLLFVLRQKEGILTLLVLQNSISLTSCKTPVACGMIKHELTLNYKSVNLKVIIRR